MSESTDFGQMYWVVGVPETTATGGYISLFADSVTISPTGDLVFFNHSKQTGSDFNGLILAKGQWLNCYAASVLDGRPVIVDNWANYATND